MRFLIFLILISSGCNSSKMEHDVFIFGQYFGYCLGDCATVYKLIGDEIYRDDNQDNHKIEMELDFVEINIANIDQLKLAKKLQNSVPHFLLESNETSFGCPDCGDWGGLHLEIISNGVSRRWTIDNMINNNPEEIQVFGQDIQSLVADLNK